MHDFGIFCKSFRDDLERAGRLIDSFEAHNVDGLPFLLSVPQRDRRLFEQRLGTGRVTLVSDEELVGRSLQQSWRAQQVVKLHVHRAGFFHAAWMVDSDFYFIRDFRARDCATAAGTPKLVLSRLCHTFDAHNLPLHAYIRSPRSKPSVQLEDCERFTHAEGRPRFPSRLRRAWLRWRGGPVDDRRARIQRVFARSGPALHVMPGPIWQMRLLERFFAEVLAPAALSPAELIEYAPWEYQWYAEWQLKLGLRGSEPCEPLFVHFARAEAVFAARCAGLTERDFARHYVGIQMAARHHAILRYD